MRFEQFCLRLAQREFPRLLSISGPWDRGRDFSLYTYLHDYRATKRESSKGQGDIIWQCKFTRRLDSNTRQSILKSIAAVVEHHHVPITRWILCLPIDPSDVFIEWLRFHIEPRGWNWQVWGRKTLLEKLASHSDLVETFFYPIYERLRAHFAVDNLELFELSLDDACEWRQPDPRALVFCSQGVENPDLVFDIIVQNSGRIDAALVGLQVHVAETESNPHGLPEQGLLFSQITYNISIKGGRPGAYKIRCDPPLLVRAGSKERFKIRLTDTGYAWMGTIRIVLDYGRGRLLPFPMMRLYT